MTRRGLWVTFFMVSTIAWAVVLGLLALATFQAVRLAEENIQGWCVGIWMPGLLALTVIGRTAWCALERATQ